ncbi:ER-Golgi vesicular transport cis-Golgi t-SNARE syntaxin, putative [Candida dubliniensis CD36]|uniref:ER-Golgi vesicular transport cis-Golgi t-SNARE syntaxin, putative n=1 Tax=Candida dubliniensis (strain CD36 / ATCC MYA-646 / CBS 7987 / NCPF 3949 / NRRL Y-17841) TaxID=573826 RepID=B9W6L7_CANDC|nr:ER-Golgi vesicular transport cis-Golgi t-SNARE syntaxin, putative [Candida dubliniensis CD36]CAX44322.1 ER-Golgi vesicular transport cis-Golgi t-SNARE syntaxin, putative [Candida dubliniensis CD36]
MSTSIQNRTIEFQQCVSTYDKINKKQNKHLNNSSALSTPKKSYFSQQAGLIAKDISHVTELLSKLAVLAKRKPIFDDKPIEIGELTYVIKQDIFKIETNIQNLQKYLKGDTSVSIDAQTTQFSKNVLTLLNSKMKNVSGEFKNVLEIRQKNEIINKNRTENFLSSVSASRSSNNQSPLVDNPNASLSNLSENPFLASSPPEHLPYDPDADPDTSSPYGVSNNGEYLSLPSQTQQMLLMEEQQYGNQQYLQQRNRAVESIESTINEVGNLFQQLATMVSEQGEQIQRIDANVEDINMNITGAQRELLKYYAHITRNRWLFLKIFGVLIVFFFLWVLVS